MRTVVIYMPGSNTSCVSTPYTVSSKSNRPPLSAPMLTYSFLLNNIRYFEISDENVYCAWVCTVWHTAKCHQVDQLSKWKILIFSQMAQLFCHLQHLKNIQHIGTWLCFKQYKLMHNHYFAHISIFRFIKNFKVHILFNRQLYVNMGEDMGGLLPLDGIVCLYLFLYLYAYALKIGYMISDDN